MKNRYFFPTILIMLIGILTALVQSESLFNTGTISYPSIGFNPGILNGIAPGERMDIVKQDLAENIFLPTEQKQTLEESNSFAIDSAMSIGDIQWQSLLSGNVQATQKMHNGNKEQNNFIKPGPVSKTISLYQGEERVIGYLSQKPVSGPAGEFFYLEVNEALNSQSEIYLEYDLYGVEDNTQVSRSINDQPVFGGYFVKQNNGWSRQSELINPDLLRQGINTIRFSIAENAKYSYTVKNVKFRIVESGSFDEEPPKAIVSRSKKKEEIQIAGAGLKESDRRLIVNQPTTAYYYRRFGYIQGFVTGKDYDKAQIRIGGHEVRAFKGEFESMVNRNYQGEEEQTDDNVLPSHAPWSTLVEAVFPDGELLDLVITFEKPAEWDFLAGFDAAIHHTEKEISQNEVFTLSLGSAILHGEAGSLQENTNLSITALRKIDLPKLNPGMVNVTAGYDGYRFLPHGSNFDKPLNITMGYDSTKLPRGHYPQEIRTYYYDESRSHWVALPRDSVNKEDYLVCSRTTHFTDMINAIVKAPEMPETQEYTPTSLKELQAADPSSGIQMMQSPTANSQGTANLSYPINVPAGRQGMQPNLAVSYSSEAANGLLGMGWDMNIPAITVDNKWGVPRYNADYETETYMYNGEELLPSARIDGFISRVADRQFYPRVEGGFEKIIRKGTNPKDYYWIVSDKQGTQYYYGTYSGTICDTSVLLKDDKGNIAHWPLCKVVDINGNYMQYCYKIRRQFSEYQPDYPVTSPRQDKPTVYLGQQLWLDAISYTGHEDETPAYKVVFSSENCSVDEAYDIGCNTTGDAIRSLNNKDEIDDNLSQRNDSSLVVSRALPFGINWEEVPGSGLQPDDPGDTGEPQEDDEPCDAPQLYVEICLSSHCRTLSGNHEFIFGMGTEKPVFKDKNDGSGEESPYPIQFNYYDNPSYEMRGSGISDEGDETFGLKACVRYDICYNNTYFLVAIPPQICGGDPISFSFRVDRDGYITTYNENGIPMIGATISTNSRGEIAIDIPIECDCKISGGSSYCYDCWEEPCAPYYCDPVCRRKVYIGVQDNFCTNDRLPLCRFELVRENDPHQRVYKYTTGYTKIQPVSVRCDEWYWVTGTYFGGNYQYEEIGFRFMVESNRNVIVDNEWGIQHPNSRIITPRYYNGGYTIEILMPVVPKPKQTRIQIVDNNGRGVRNYNFLLGNTNNDKIEGVYTTDANGYTPALNLQAGIAYYIGEVDFTVYNYNSLYGRSPYSSYVANWSNKVQLYLLTNGCNLRIGYETNFIRPFTTSCAPDLCTITYREPSRAISKNIQVKKTATDGELITGAVFNLNGTTNYQTGTNGLTSPITITNGQTYTLRETSVPAGFILDDRPITISMNNTGVISVNSAMWISYNSATQIINVTNSRSCVGFPFMVMKKDAKTGEVLQGAVIKYFKNNDRNNPIDISSTDPYGRTHEVMMNCGETYYIKEAAVPLGYESQYAAFAVVRLNHDENIEVLESDQLESYSKVNDIWQFTFVNHKRDTSAIDTIPTIPGCSTTYAFDNTINTRNGFRQSSKEKLSKIVVFYKDSCVRTYTFCYGRDFFGRARLEEITQWGSEDTLEAFVHTIEYYDDVVSHRNLFQARETITLTDNEKDIDQSKRISKKLRNFFLRGFVSPSLLGGSRTWSTGINAGADIGLFPAFPLKTLSGGIYTNASISSSKGKTTIMDINGDGLPDRVYNEMEGLTNKTYYLLQKPDRQGFKTQRKELNGVKIFLKDFSDNASIGLQASAFVHGGIQKGFLGNSWTNVYFADLDGDGFMDLVSSNGVRKFGVHQKPPSFNFPDCLPPIIETTEDTIIVRCDTNFSFTPDVYERDRTDELRYDLVRVWQADMDLAKLPDLTYGICAPVHLAYDSTALENFCGTPDAVIVSIEYYGKGLTGNMDHILLWSDVIGDSDMSNHGPEHCTLINNPTSDPKPEIETDGKSCPIMLRKVTGPTSAPIPLGNVVFTLADGTELITDASNNGLTEAFYIENTGECIDVVETTTLPHCNVSKQPFSICKEGDDTDCKITVYGQGRVSKEKIDGREVYVITITNDCHQQPMCFARILKLDQYRRPLEGVEFTAQTGLRDELYLTTDNQGFTSLINIFAGRCSDIHEIFPLPGCNDLGMPIHLCTDDQCNLNVDPPHLVDNITSEIINGMLIHTITIINHCPYRAASSASEISQIENIERAASISSGYINPNYNLSSLKLAKGDKLYFRVRPQNNGVKKKVVWDPAVIPYSRSLSRVKYLDENGRIFGGGNKASQSQLLQGDSLFFLPAKGNITIESVINPLPSKLTDAITYEIWLDNTRIYYHTISAGQITGVQTFSRAYNVDTNNRLKFKVVSKSNVNMHNIHWYPKVYYNFLNNGSERIDAVIYDDDSNLVRMLEYDIAPYHDFYHQTTNLSNNCLNKIYNTSTGSQTLYLPLSKISINAGASGKAYITIKQDGVLLFAREMNFIGGTITPLIISNVNLPIKNDPNKPVYISCYVNDPVKAAAINNCYVVINNYRYYGVIYTKYKRDVLEGEYYGGWGQFLYQTDVDANSSPMAKMDRNKLQWFSTLTSGNITQMVDTSRMGGDSIRDLRAFAKTSDYDTRFAAVKDGLFCLPMFNEPAYKGHVGYYANAFIRGADMNIGGIPCPDYDEDENDPCENSSSRSVSPKFSQGGELSSVVSSKGISKGEEFASIEDLGVPARAGAYGNVWIGANVLAGMDPKKTSKSSNTSYSAGLSVPGISLGLNESTTTTIQNNDLMDLNGDGFPDIIRPGKVYYSFPKAATWETEPKNPFYGQTHHQTITNTFGSSYTADPMGFINLARNSNKGNSIPVKSQEEDMFFAGNIVAPVGMASSINIVNGISNTISRNGNNGNNSILDMFNKSETRSEDHTEWTLMDINGDGLPDRVYNTNKNVALNLGYSFENREYWELGEIGLNIGNAYSNSLGKGLGGKEFAGGSMSYSGGISGSKSYSQTSQMLADINGDGLPDKVVLAGVRTLHIHYNTGCGYNTYADVITLDESDPALYEWSTTHSKGGNLGLTLGFPIVWFAKVSVTAGVDASFSLSSSNIQFMDMDGDGYADLVIAPDENTLIIRYSNLGRTGLLKKVSNPMGGSMELTYHKTEASVRHSRRWVMDTVKVYDGWAGDGADVMLTSHEYKEGYYDRNERAFYGFAIVNEKHHNTQEDNVIYRKYNRYYYNNNFYNKGLLLTEEVRNGSGDSLYMVTMNKYSNQTLTNRGNSKYVTLDTTIICYYEGTPNAEIRQQKTFDYDSYGRIKRQKTTSTNMPTVETRITYHTPVSGNYNISVPRTVRVTGSGSHRKRNIDIDDYGRIIKISDYVSFSSSVAPLTTTMVYDNMGNCTYIEYPGGSSFSYEYETDVHTYPKKVTDAFGHFSQSLNYNYRFGVPRTVIDKNGHYMFYTFDQFGRTTEICAPKEQTTFRPIALDVNNLDIAEINLATGEPINMQDFPLGGLRISSREIIPIKQNYTVKYVYRYGNMEDNIPFSAVTYNYDPANEGNNITTYTFSDGLGRIIQTKKDAVVNGEDAVVISGKVEYDAFGRTVKTWYPSIEEKLTPVVVGDPMAMPIVLGGDLGVISVIRPQGNLVMVPLESEDNIHPSTTEYDILDRPKKQTTPNLSADFVTTYDYGFGTDNSHTLFETKVTDPKGYESFVLKNVNDLQYGLKAAGQPWVYFEYNPMGECTQVYGNDFSRSYTYDMLGRKVSYEEGDLSESYTYNGPNLETKTMSWLHGDETAEINYTYDRNRLMEMQTSDNDIITMYEYDDQNMHGKLKRIHDESGIQEFEYGSMGEVTKVKRIYGIDIYTSPFAVEMQFSYDSWGRIDSLVYPDGEIVKYQYDKGGMLKSFSGKKDMVPYNYIKEIKYDKFGAKKGVMYGNDLSTAHTYDPHNLRLMSSVTTYGGTAFQNTSYRYDKNGNIIYMKVLNAWPEDNHWVEQTFDYDSTNQLVEATGKQPNAGNNIYTLNVSYDAYGKINTYNADLRDKNLNVVQQQNNTFAYQNSLSTAFAPVSSHDLISNTTTSYTFGINGSLRTKTTPEKTEYYLFNALNNLKVYSDNGESYGYYGYDASGERTYKIQYKTVSSRVNRYGVVTKTLETDKITYYPNGYINIDQSGNYTKHYYADEMRIASKIGSGNNNESLDAVNEMDFFRCYESYNARLKELGEVIIPAEEINPLMMSDEVNTLYGDNQDEDELFFYHGDHLSSVRMVTDLGRTVKHGAVYAPFGEVLYEYNAYWKEDTIPRYLFNGKELDDESGMYYYSARYYAPPTFISRDPHFESYPTMSPYAYCANNPVKYIDPTGMDLDVTNENAQADITNLVSEDNRKYLTFKDNKVGVDFGNMSDDDKLSLLREDKGLSLVNDLVSSNKTYLYDVSDVSYGIDRTTGERVETSNNANDNKPIDIMSISPRNINGGVGSKEYKPDGGYDGYVRISPGEFAQQSADGKVEWGRNSTVFHELAEVYGRTTHKMPYIWKSGNGAHKYSAVREGNYYGNATPGYNPGSIVNGVHTGYRR